MLDATARASGSGGLGKICMFSKFLQEMLILLMWEPQFENCYPQTALGARNIGFCVEALPQNSLEHLRCLTTLPPSLPFSVFLVLVLKEI